MRLLKLLSLWLLLPVIALAQSGAGGGGQSNVGGGGSGGTGGVVGGTFGGNPSSGYTFTSTPVATAPFTGNLLVGCNINAAATGTYTAGAGYTLTSTGTAALAMEQQVAGSATSYSAPFTYSVNSTNTASTIATFSNVGTAAAVQGRSLNAATALAFTSNTGTGNLLVACFRYNGATAAPMTGVAGSAGGGETFLSCGARALEGYAKGATDNNYLECWYFPNSKGGADTITGTMGGGTTGGATHVSIGEFSGVATTTPLVDYNFTGSTTSVTSIPGATTNSQYLIQAVNNTTGTVDFSGRDSCSIFRSAANAKQATGASLYFKSGIYPCQTSLQESVASLTNWYGMGLPAPLNGTTAVTFTVNCEMFTQPLYAAVQTSGCIHQILPSAYAGPQPSGNTLSGTLSGFWQRPNATWGATNNNAIFFYGGTVRVPDNQHTPTRAFDTSTTIYSYHKDVVADTNIAVLDQLCSGLTPAAGGSGYIGFYTNQASTDESYFENTWAIGYETPYNVVSNHPFMLNSHAVCNQNGGKFTVTASLYGGELRHYQENHNISGITINCTSPGTRYDIDMVREVVVSGSFTFGTNASETVNGNCVGGVHVTTGVAASTVVVPAFWNAGSGARMPVIESTKIMQPGLVTSNSTSAATTGTGKQTLATYTFTYNTAGGAGVSAGPFQNNTGGVFRIKAWGTALNNANSKVFELDFGGTAIATITATINVADSVKCEADIIVASGSNVQEVIGYCDDGTTRTVTRSAPAITGNANIILNAAATTAIASGDFTFKGMTIEYLGGN